MEKPARGSEECSVYSEFSDISIKIPGVTVTEDKILEEEVADVNVSANPETDHFKSNPPDDPALWTAEMTACF